MEINHSKNTERIEFLGFHEALRNTINAYNGEYKEIVKYCPALFELLCKMLNDKVTDWNTKLMIDAALAYFVLPEDVIPDHEEAGYVDDLYIVCYVLKEIKQNDLGNLIESNWNESEDILSLIDDLYEKSSLVVGQLTHEVLRKVGLQKYQSMDLADYDGSYPQRFQKVVDEKRELLGLLAYLVRAVYRVNMRSAKTEQLKEFLEQHGDYDEITRLIELSKRNHTYNQPERRVPPTYNPPRTGIEDLQAQLRAARLDALVKDDADKEDGNK